MAQQLKAQTIPPGFSSQHPHWVALVPGDPYFEPLWVPILNLSVRFPSGELGVVAQAWSPSSSRWRPEGREFKASLGYRVP